MDGSFFSASVQVRLGASWGLRKEYLAISMFLNEVDSAGSVHLESYSSFTQESSEMSNNIVDQRVGKK